ncbi:pilus assembly protein [Pandoraea apista]|uniref:tetratricopeptide repeat protein n=1 Tax=Pandoraea apista TaxID=93218 RepID=UPI000CE95807|nr:tetratricopeptide repeat protein [Pandoraea apista]AVF41192.1 pilus assembly protein [Pandoraea apista]
MTLPISTHAQPDTMTVAVAQHERQSARAIAGALIAMLCAATLAGCGGPRIGGYGAPSAAALMQAQQNDEEKARAAKPDSRELYLSMIRQMQEQGSYFASLAHIEQFRLQYGTAPDIDILRADALRETGQPDAAEQAYRLLLSGDESAAAWHGLGLVAAQRKDYAAAAQALREAVSRAPTEAFYLSDLGFALLNNGDTGAARVPLAQAAELRPDSRKVLSNLAVYLVVAGERSRAEDMMTHAKMPQATRDAIDKLAADIGARVKARRAEAARAAAQAAATIAPPAPRVATAAQRGAGSAGANANAVGTGDGPVVVRLTSGSESVAGPAQTQVKAATSDAKLARAGDVSRSDMPTSMLDRFGHSQ